MQADSKTLLLAALLIEARAEIATLRAQGIDRESEAVCLWLDLEDATNGRRQVV